MSTAVAIAATTRVLTTLLQERLATMDADGAFRFGATTASPPDRLAAIDSGEPHLNLFLYQLVDVTLHGLEGRVPALRLDLHYLLSAYGKDLESQVALGAGIAAIVATPVLTGAIIQGTFAAPLSPLDLKLEASNLGRQDWTIAIALQTLTLEEITNLWTACGSRYRTSVALRVSTIVIDA